MRSGKGERTVTPPVGRQIFFKPGTVPNCIVGQFAAESDRVSMKIQEHRHRYLAPKIRETVSERECDAGDALGCVEIPVKQAVANGSPAELAMETDVQTVFLKNSGFQGDS